MIHVVASAKINLALEVIGPRDDGYHDIATVMAAIDVTDEIVVLQAADESLVLECNDPALGDDVENTVTRAADVLSAATGVRRGARMLLRKSIPVAAGLGGGSADAAATLVALNRLWDTGLSQNDLKRLAAEVGSDVPFFLSDSPTAFAEGRGELVTPLPPLAGAWVVVVIPEVPVPSPKTRVLYRFLGSEHHSGGQHVRGLRDHIVRGDAFPGPRGDAGMSINTFNAVAERAYPGIGVVRRAFQEIVGDAWPVGLTGTGPGLYALFATREAAAGVYDALTGRGVPALLAGMADRPLTISER